jgi:hypothetical protein
MRTLDPVVVRLKPITYSARRSSKRLFCLELTAIINDLRLNRNQRRFRFGESALERLASIILVLSPVAGGRNKFDGRRRDQG